MMGFNQIARCLALSAVLAGCESSPPSPEAQARQQAVAEAELEHASAFCDLVDALNARYRTHGKPLPENDDCAYFRRNGTLEGYRAKSYDGLVGLPDNLRRIGDYRRAMRATPPQNIARQGEEAVDLYRKMLTRGFVEEDVAAVSASAPFRRAVAAFRRAHAANEQM